MSKVPKWPVGVGCKVEDVNEVGAYFVRIEGGGRNGTCSRRAGTVVELIDFGESDDI